jgi:hypothetical protein
VVIGRLVVAPTHHQVTLCAGQRALWLDPGMAFGSGHHETTYLALAALEAPTCAAGRVLDVGSGSGIWRSPPICWAQATPKGSISTLRPFRSLRPTRASTSLVPAFRSAF